MLNKQRGSVEGIFGGIVTLLFMGIVLSLMFFALDWNTGEHGRLTITAIDKNLFGTYTVYARNSESAVGSELTEVTYCIDADNQTLADFAKKNVGAQNVKLVYPDRRIGFYGFSKCHSAPIKEIVLSN